MDLTEVYLDLLEAIVFVFRNSAILSIVFLRTIANWSLLICDTTSVISSSTYCFLIALFDICDNYFKY